VNKKTRLRIKVLAAAITVSCAALWLYAADGPIPTLDKAQQLFRQGNYKESYEAFRRIALAPTSKTSDVSSSLDHGVQSLANLGRVDEIDEFREQVIATHAKNWRVLETAARNFENGVHYGYIVAGKFYRGDHRGGGRYVNSAQRDRVRALQLLQQAQPLAVEDADKKAVGSFYLHFAHTLVQGTGYVEPWRLQELSDLKELPDYEDGWYWRGQTAKGAPVDAEGNPIFHKVPKSYDLAQSDGERWRWFMLQAIEADPARRNEVDILFADFLRSQFDVQTMARFGRMFDDDSKNESGIFAVHTLKDDETIAQLASGIKRFKLPDEFNFITIYQNVAQRGRSQQGEHARDMIAGIYADRRQYPKAAEAWRKGLAEYGNNGRQQNIDQIVGAWGRFEPGSTQPAGTNPTIDYRFRNGNRVKFGAWSINVSKLLDDAKNYLTNHRGQLDWKRMNISDIGQRLVYENERQYFVEKVADWSMDLKPRPSHFDERITVTAPLTKPGAYLITSEMAGGNVSRVLIWVADTAIVKKNLDNKALYFVADAVSGAPLAGADVEFFGWQQVQAVPNQNIYRVETKRFVVKSDADGQIMLGNDKMPNTHQWLITARKDNRFAYHGFSHTWFGNRHDAEYNATKIFTMTDRPVYRPTQTVQFKAWIRHAKYDQPDTSDFAKRGFTVRIANPKGEKAFEGSFTTDEYAGLSGEMPLPKSAQLGVYHISIHESGTRGHLQGGGSFRVEEYKKPEFEVTVEAPKEPVQLGEKIDATILAKYYFGSPVTNAKVKFTVKRSNYSSRWYPRGDWDWFYGRGYWWFAYDYDWYPGFASWGCMRPIPPWWGHREDPPEIVSEQEMPIGIDGKVKVPIDTATAKELHPDQDHQYTITAEVVDESRRTIVGEGKVLVARKPFQVFAWLGRGHYRAGDTIQASFKAQTLDQKAVEGKGELSLVEVTYNDKQEPVEKPVQSWKLDTDAQGEAKLQIKAAKAGQYRLSYKVTDSKKHTIEGGYVFVVRGESFDGKDFRFNDIEIITDKREYAPNEKIKLLVNTNKNNGTVLLFLRPSNGIYLAPKVIRLKGKSVEEEIAVTMKDMPNFFIEAMTVADGRVHTEVREVIVPPEKRVVNVEVLPSATEYRPGQPAKVKVKLTDQKGQPFVGSTVMSIYDRSVEYISGGSNVGDIREFFWKWRRSHYPGKESSLDRYFHQLFRRNETSMADIGVFGHGVVEDLRGQFKGRSGATRENMLRQGGGFGGGFGGGPMDRMAPMAAAPAGPGGGGFGGGGGGMPGMPAAPPMAGANADDRFAGDKAGDPGNPGQPPAGVEPTIRRNFADTAFWTAGVTTNKDGVAEIELKMPENLTGWKIKVWAMGHGTKVGQGETEVTTKKDLLVRLQAPRFFVQKDEVVLSANVHNYLKAENEVTVSLQLGGNCLEPMANLVQKVSVPSGADRRVDWRVKVTGEGEAVVRVLAVAGAESDAMEMRFPAYIHGMLKQDSFSGVVRPDKSSAAVSYRVPEERRINDSRLEVRYSPTLAGALVDALPYLVEYPYGCTEQTMNRFVPTVVTQHILQKLGVNLKDIQEKRTNLNAQEIGNDKERAKGWKRFPRNPVFDEDEVKAMVAAGIQTLQAQQLSDGGWGWFSGFGEHSYPHTTAVVVHGLQIARLNDVILPGGMLERGIDWLKTYQAQETQKIRNAPTKTKPWKQSADNLDAFVYMILMDQNVTNDEMRDYLYRDRNQLAVHGKAMLGLALHKQKQAEPLAMILRNIEQYLVQDEENQTAYLKLPADTHWWYWYGSEIESNAYYLKLLARTQPKDEKASRLVKYLLNNRKHSTYWTNTRDTATCIEAMAEYLVASGEDKPDMTVEIWLDGKKHKEARITAENLFTFDNQFVLFGDAIESGNHTLEVKRKGTGPVYFNAYLTNFTLEDHITKAGLEVKVNRKYYKLTKVDKKVNVQDAGGRPTAQKVEKYERSELANLAELKSGDLVEVELEIDSKNDYEYLIFEDPKAAGFEPVLLRSGYNPNDMGAYMELRDAHVAFFVRALARGKHSISYRLRAEIPGQFSALPTKGYAMYAPELKGNSDEIKLKVRD